MANVTFDGATKLMTVTAGGSEINVEKDLYSGWKHWVASADNSKYLQAFRTFGGDPTSSGQYAPKYFFLLNGWRIAIDGSVTPNVDVALNLYVDGGGNPFVLSNNAVVSNLRSDVAVVESELQDTLDYAGQIVYDFIDGQEGQVHPTGTLAYPVNNCADLQALMDLFDINKVMLQSNILIQQDFDNVLWVTNTAAEFMNPNNHSMTNSFFQKMTVQGDFTNSQIVMQDCAIGNCTGLFGVANNCHMAGNIQIQPNQQMVLSNCASALPGTASPVIDMYPGAPTGLSLRAYSGGVKIINCDHSGDTSTLEFIAGKAHIEPSCTNGYISVRGVAELNDNSAGTVIDTAALFNTANEYGGKVHVSCTGSEQYPSYPGSSYPVGTALKPVNNWADAKLIMEKYHIHDVLIHGSCTLDVDLPTTKFESAAGIIALNIGGMDVNGGFFSSMMVYGDWNHSQVIVDGCVVESSYNFHGIFKESSFEGILTLSPSGETTMVDCVGGDAQERMDIDMGVGIATTLNVRRYAGALNILNADDPNDVAAIIMDAGKVWIDSSCTDGTIHINGIATIYDNSSGTTVGSEAHIDPSVQAAQLNEILGLSQSNFSMTDQIYNEDGSLLTAVIKTYFSAAELNSNSNPIATYNVTATYDGSGVLNSYKVAKA